MSELDDNIVVDFDVGRVCRVRYMQCKACKQVKYVDEFVSKHSKRIYNKTCRACFNNNEKSRLKGKE